MDAVELPSLVEVAALKLTGSEGLIGAGVVVKEAESDFVSGLPSSSIEHCCNSGKKDKSPLVKQKNSSIKRSDKRNARVPSKTKSDSFFTKAGFASFSSSAAGSNIFGVYGLKSEIREIAELLDEPPLTALIDGTYECRSLGKENGKKEAKLSDNFMHSFRKACSILQISRPVHSQVVTESCSSKTTSTLSSVPVAAAGEGESCATDKIPDSCARSDISGTPLDCFVRKPDDIFHQLVLPPPKDLDSLLLDAIKPSVSSRNVPDLRSGKQVARRVSLPCFPWSNMSNGHCRTNSDSAKLSARSTCRGRWLRMTNVASYMGIGTDCFTHLESLTFDQSLVPSVLKTDNLESKISLTVSATLPQSKWVSSSSSTFPKPSFLTEENEGNLKIQANGHCQTAVTAALTLCDIAARPWMQNLDRMMRWPKSHSQKSTKARKFKSGDTAEEAFATPVSRLGGGHVSQIISSKKPKLTTENKKNVGHSNGQGLTNWSAPRSNRSSQSKFNRDLISDTRYSSSGITKQLCMMPPPKTPWVRLVRVNRTRES